MNQTPATWTVRPAQPRDRTSLLTLLSRDSQAHRHLDWRHPLEWLDRPGFFVLEDRGDLLAALACPVDPPGCAWLRVFCVSPGIPRHLAWARLLRAARTWAAGQQPAPVLCAIGLSTPVERLLEASGFSHRQDIVVLEWLGERPGPVTLPPGCHLRRLEPRDLEAVTHLDNLAFDRLWRYTSETMAIALGQAAWATVLEWEGAIVGYQISTEAAMNAHLARLAVDPQRQRAGLGAALVNELLRHFQDRLAWSITVNTQSDNHASLALYDRLGFQRTGEVFPVMQLLENAR